MHRIVIFIHGTSYISSILIRGTFAALEAREDLKLAAICITNPQNNLVRFSYDIFFRIYFKIESFFDSDVKQRQSIPLPINLNRFARNNQIRILTPPQGNINHPKFIKQLTEEIRPSIALSYFCFQKFSPELLRIFQKAVNYHNGHLPKYRGLKATKWSVYHGEKETYFTFHEMVEKMDAGEIYVQRSIPVESGQNTFELELRKAKCAVEEIPQLLNLLAEGASGIQQGNDFNYFSHQDFVHITTIPNPSVLTRDELMKRLRAFGGLWIKFSNNSWHRVTKIQSIPVNSQKTAWYNFKTSDGILMKAVRFQSLPFSLYRVLRCLPWVGKQLSMTSIPRR